MNTIFSITLASICPAFLIALSILQGMIFLSSARAALNGESDTAFSAHNTLSREEYATLFTIQGKVKFYILPLLAVFAFFFPSVYKIVCSVLIYVLSFVLSKCVFLITRKRQNESGKNEK